MEYPKLDFEREAWSLLLNGAEDHVKNDLNEDGTLTAEEHRKIIQLAEQFIDDLRKEHDVKW